MMKFYWCSIFLSLIGTIIIILMLNDTTPFWKCDEVYHNNFQQQICFDMSLRSVLIIGGMSYGFSIAIFLIDRNLSKKELQFGGMHN